jgi:hypothetical protein
LKSKSQLDSSIDSSFLKISSQIEELKCLRESAPSKIPKNFCSTYQNTFIFTIFSIAGGQMSQREEELLQVATPIAQWLGSSNSCINPILYAFFNKKYRKGFVAIIRSKKCCGKLR